MIAVLVAALPGAFVSDLQVVDAITEPLDRIVF
jgi:hypothetical protein